MARRPVSLAWLPSHRLPLFLLVAALLTPVMVSGCGSDDSSDTAAQQTGGSEQANGALQTSAVSQTAAAGQASSANTPRDIWEAVLFDGQHVGYAHTAVRPADEPGRLSVDYTLSLQLKRFGDAAKPAMKVNSIQSVAGQPISFTVETALAAQPMTTRGQVQDGRLVIERSGDGQPQEVPLDADVLGFWGVEASLLAQPLKPGEKRQFRALDPTLLTVMNHELTAADYHDVQLLDETLRLLQIDLVSRLPGRLELQFRLWADEQGQILKRESVGLGVQQTLIVTTQQRATGTTGQFDLGSSSVVPVSKAMPNAHDLRQARYRVRLKSGNPAQVFKPSPQQQVQPIDQHTAEVVVAAADWQQVLKAAGNTAPSATVGPAPPAEPGSEPATDADLQPGRLIASDHPEIARLAREAAPVEAATAEVALALERFVHRSIQQVNYKTVLGSAADVVQKMEGDCTEHAVLLAAMARARGIPSRVAVGLVYVPNLKGFAFHMWTQVHVAGRWMPLDATLGQGGTGPAHLTLLATNLADDGTGGDSLAALLPVAQVMGQLEIEVLETSP